MRLMLSRTSRTRPGFPKDVMLKGSCTATHTSRKHVMRAAAGAAHMGLDATHRDAVAVVVLLREVPLHDNADAAAVRAGRSRLQPTTRSGSSGSLVLAPHKLGLLKHATLPEHRGCAGTEPAVLVNVPTCATTRLDRVRLTNVTRAHEWVGNTSTGMKHSENRHEDCATVASASADAKRCYSWWKEHRPTHPLTTRTNDKHSAHLMTTATAN